MPKAVRTISSTDRSREGLAKTATIACIFNHTRVQDRLYRACRMHAGWKKPHLLRTRHRLPRQAAAAAVPASGSWLAPFPTRPATVVLLSSNGEPAAGPSWCKQQAYSQHALSALVHVTLRIPRRNRFLGRKKNSTQSSPCRRGYLSDSFQPS